MSSSLRAAMSSTAKKSSRSRGSPLDPDAAGPERDAQLRVAHLARMRAAAASLASVSLVAGAQRDGRVHGAMAGASVELGGPGHARGAQRGRVGRVAAVRSRMLVPGGARVSVSSSGADQDDLRASTSTSVPSPWRQVAGEVERDGGRHRPRWRGRWRARRPGSRRPCSASTRKQRGQSGEERAHRSEETGNTPACTGKGPGPCGRGGAEGQAAAGRRRTAMSRSCGRRLGAGGPVRYCSRPIPTRTSATMATTSTPRNRASGT